MERWLVGMAMSVIAYLIEKSMLRSIKRNSAKSNRLRTDSRFNMTRAIKNPITPATDRKSVV